ncbi:RraA family protein [candidate division KSB1 bacterium]|nr:RraA family protein [candidate division KSB1 bacterium]
MKRLILFCLVGFCAQSFSQTASPEELQVGKSFLPTMAYSQQENQELLTLYEGLRVADVSDGMDMVGLPGTGLVDPAIQADWQDRDSLKHIFRGVALTVRYVPTQLPDRPAPDKEFTTWEGQFYSQLSSETWTQLIQPGTAIVIDDVQEKDIGSIGSNNILGWTSRGAVGVVTDAGARDTDEVALQKVPLYLRKKGRGIRPGRNQLESVNMPVVIGGVLVRPGDIVVADGDGVIIVPRRVARQVAKYAHDVLAKDKTGRKNLYEKLGLPLDQTVK